MSRKPQLLVLAQTLPYPPDGGVWIRTYNLLRALSDAFALRLLCFERAIAPGQGHTHNQAESVEALRQIGPTDVFPIPQRHSRARFAWDHLRSLLTGQTFTHFLYESAPFRRCLREVVRRGNVDLVHVDSLDLCAYLPELDGLPVACTHHNVESALLRRRAAAEQSRLLGAYAALQARLTEKDERYWCPRVALNVTVSADDAAALRTLAPEGKYLVVPNGVDVDLLRPGEARVGGGLVFVGATSWFPNRDGMEYFCQEILPLVRQKRPELTVTWVGAARADERQRFAERYGIELTGYVPDIRPYAQAAECYIVPLRVGGGSRLKILDAWAMGKTVVSTSVGCEGLATEPDTNVVVADSPATFAQGIDRVLTNATLRAAIGRAARETAERLYSWNVVGQTLVQAYEDLLRGSRLAEDPGAAGRQ